MRMLICVTAFRTGADVHSGSRMTSANSVMEDAKLASTRSQSYELTLHGLRGPRLSVAQFPGTGKAGPLLIEADTVSVWSGGRSDVTVHHRRAPTGCAETSRGRIRAIMTSH